MGIISNKSHYALKAVLELAKCENRGPISISHISSKQEIPARFLEAILRELKQGGIVNSVRGKDGGYMLTKSPANISITEVLSLFSKNFVFKEDVIKKNSIFNEIAESAESTICTFFDAIDFKTLCEKEKKVNFVPEYNI